MSLLDAVEGPKALRALPPTAMPDLCAELRAEIICVCGRQGGHLGASLGAVEMCVALHRVFHSPVDRLVFDVGHQAYAHKLLTGRRGSFSTLRQEGGTGPFLDPDESEHDAFAAGHASTAISAGLGLLAGKRLQGLPGKVVAIVGDGALTGGLAFEGLNNASSVGPLIVLLNDNGMSISRNVGAVPELLRHAARPFFESLGFSYVGPVDGHDVAALERVFREARAALGPVVIHAHTHKGKGLPEAEADLQTRGHSMGPYDFRDGKLVRSRGGQETYSDALASALAERMRRDAKVVAVTPAMLEGSSLVGLKAEFPQRVFDVGIAEQHAVTFAAGLAREGMKPVVCIYSTFLQRALDQVIHDVALKRLKVVFAVDRAGLVGADGATHQGTFDVAALRAIPGFRVAAMSWKADVAKLLDDALDGDGPCALRFPRGIIPSSPRPGPEFQAARWLRKVRGADLNFITLGPMGQAALDATALSPTWGVLDAVWVAPLDEVRLAEAAQASALVVVEEAWPRGGLGAAVLGFLARQGLQRRVRCLALPLTFVPHGNAMAQRRALGLDTEGLAKAATELLERR